MNDGRVWIDNRLRELVQIFSIAVGGFSVMDNHLHVLVRLDPQVAARWSDEEVVRRWKRLLPPRDKSRQPSPVSDAWVENRLKHPDWVARGRTRLQSLGWFMKCLKEPLARLANREEKVRRAFFEGRFKSVAILDEEALLATCACIDLNPVAAGIAEVPEASEHTSIKERVEHVEAQGRTEDLKAARKGSVAGWRARALSDARECRCVLGVLTDSIGKTSLRQRRPGGNTTPSWFAVAAPRPGRTSVA